MALRLYEKASEPGARYFLDKTPRYSLVLDELFETFPDARAIFLWRNPLAVVASIAETWFQGRWAPYQHHVDLYAGLGGLVAARQRYAGRTVEVRYEDLVTQPTAALQSILAYLDLGWDEAVVSDLRTARLDGPVGDQVGVHRYSAVSRESIDCWKTTLAAPVRKAWCRRYLDWVGDERLAVMGYDREVLRKELDALPNGSRRLLPDLWSSGRSAVCLAVEPAVVRSKLRGLRAPRAVHLHD